MYKNIINHLFEYFLHRYLDRYLDRYIHLQDWSGPITWVSSALSSPLFFKVALVLLLFGILIALIVLIAVLCKRNRMTYEINASRAFGREALQNCKLNATDNTWFDT